MTMGPGRSDCCRGGVTYGYREYLRKGRVRQKLRRKFAGSSGLDEFAESFIRKKAAIQSASLIYLYAISATNPAKTFRGISSRPYIEKSVCK